MSDSTKNRKYKTYNALVLALRKAGITAHGTTATLLLEALLENEGRLLASTVYSRGLCEENKFKEWRKNLIDKGWLVWCEAQADKGKYHPGKKLLPYINKEILARKELATRESVESLRSDVIAVINENAGRSAMELKAVRSVVETKADKSELDETRRELETTKKKIEEIAAAVKDLQDAMIPPDTPQKRASREKAALKIASLAQAN